MLLHLHRNFHYFYSSHSLTLYMRFFLFAIFDGYCCCCCYYCILPIFHRTFNFSSWIVKSARDNLWFIIHFVVSSSLFMQSKRIFNAFFVVVMVVVVTVILLVMLFIFHVHNFDAILWLIAVSERFRECFIQNDAK